MLPDGSLDLPRFRALIDWHVEQGTDGLVIVGTTGESPTLNHEEHQRVVDVVIEGLGLNIGQLKADMNSPEVATRMQQDANDAVTMKVTATPEYFVNGRPLPSFGEQQLLTLVNEELQNAY
jgi:dihydrodipicolinate synthase/N-acetylneuraminate lyase